MDRSTARERALFLRALGPRLAPREDEMAVEMPVLLPGNEYARLKGIETRERNLRDSVVAIKQMIEWAEEHNRGGHTFTKNRPLADMAQVYAEICIALGG